MEKKINIAELLQDCPKGMELDCLIYDNVTLESVSIECEYAIRINTRCGFSTILTKYGQNVRTEDAKCVIFPKGKSTWEGFVPPCQFKDGDILSNGICICIYDGNENDEHYGCYAGVGHIDNPDYFINHPQNRYFTKENSRLATKEETEKLFKTIKDNGRKWNAETKTLEKLVEPKFKVGDKIANDDYVVEITEIDSEEEVYIYELKVGGIGCILFSEQEGWELVPNKFDINTLKPFDKVLAMYCNATDWKADFFSHYDEEMQNSPFCCIGAWYEKCIPYEGNEHLLGTSDECDEYYKNWK